MTKQETIKALRSGAEAILSYLREHGGEASGTRHNEAIATLLMSADKLEDEKGRISKFSKHVLAKRDSVEATGENPWLTPNTKQAIEDKRINELLSEIEKVDPKAIGL